MALKILVVDDDHIAGTLSKELLQEAGYDADLLDDSTHAVAQIREKRYPIVILDILMPGLDGLTLCHQIKSDPELKSTKVIMVSGKSFDAEIQRARQYGADLFIKKPYDVEGFAAAVAEVAGRKREETISPLSAPRPEELSSRPAALNVKVWGCRSETRQAPSRYGRKTACVSISVEKRTLIFDAGSGLPELGAELMANRPGELNMFLTHFHKDHVEGLGAFPCLRHAGWSLRVGAAREPDKGLDKLVADAIEETLTGAEPVAAEIELYEMLEESYEPGHDLLVTSFYANHPGNTLGFIVETAGRKLVYCPDSEVYGEHATALHDFDEKLGRLARGADLLILDGRYTAEDYRSLRNGGHSAWTAAVDLAARNEVKRLLLFHQDSRYSDEELDRVAVEAARRAAESGTGLRCALAREGASISL